MVPNINIDTRSPQYVQLLGRLAALRGVLSPRIKLLRQLKAADSRDGTAKARQWLQRDPLLRRTIIMAQSFAEMIDEELVE